MTEPAVDRAVTGRGPRILPMGDAAWLVDVESTAEVGRVVALHRALDADRLVGVVDLVPAARTVLVMFDPGLVAALAVQRWIGEIAGTATDVPDADATADAVDAEHIVVPVHYDGEDLDEVCRHTGLDPDAVIAEHTAAVWTVAFTGFAPGFAYLTGGTDRLRVPRRATPRTVVPAGAVALAGEYCGVYPRATPGGWQLIGRTEAVIWDVAADPPALLRPGATVRFERVGP